MATDYANYTGLEEAQAKRDQALQRLQVMGNARNMYADQMQKKMEAELAAEKAKALDMQQEQSRNWLDTGLTGAATGLMAGGPVGALVGGGVGLGLGLWGASKNTKGGFSNAITHPLGQHVDVNDIYGAMGPLASLSAGAASRFGGPSNAPKMGTDRFGNSTADFSGMSNMGVDNYNAGLDTSMSPSMMAQSAYSKYQGMPSQSQPVENPQPMNANGGSYDEASRYKRFGSA